MSKAFGREGATQILLYVADGRNIPVEYDDSVVIRAKELGTKIPGFISLGVCLGHVPSQCQGQTLYDMFLDVALQDPDNVITGTFSTASIDKDRVVELLESKIGCANAGSPTPFPDCGCHCPCDKEGSDCETDKAPVCANGGTYSAMKNCLPKTT